MSVNATRLDATVDATGGAMVLGAATRDDRSVDLDDLAFLEQTDPSRMRDLMAGFPAQARAAWTAGQRWPLPQHFRAPRRVLIYGMGGSAIGGDLVATLAARTSPTPVHVVRGYASPPVNEETLVIASSFSGDTEETLAAFEAAIGRTDMLLAFASGGRLAHRAIELGRPLFSYRFGGPPRSALGYGFFPLLAILDRLGIGPTTTEAATSVLASLPFRAGEWGPENALVSNGAKQLAARLEGKLPVVVGTGFLEVAARRWAAQINENAKQWAFHAALPEIDHNLVLGFAGPDARKYLHVLFLDAPSIDERERRRVVLTANLLDEAGVTHDELLIGGHTPLDSLMRACYLVDWVSLYLAALNNVDPTPKVAIDRLKAALGRHGG